MRRRRFLGTLGLSVAGLAGCAWRPGGSAPDGEGSSNECRTPSELESPSKDNLTLEYTVSGNGGSHYEIIDLFNKGDSPVDLTNYSVAFEDQDVYHIDNIELIPEAELKFLTFGDKNIHTVSGDCSEYRHVIENRLDAPLFEDDRATVALLEPDGNHLLEEEFVIKV